MKIALVGLLGLSMLKGCDMGDPASVQPKMEDALRPYFPKVKAVALPQDHALVGLSCIENVGDEMVKMVAPAVASNPAMSQLKLLRFLPGSSYKIVAIGFEQGLAFYDVDTGATGTMPQAANYTTWYRQQCGLDNVASTTPARYGSAVWIGHFTATLDMPDGKRTTAIVVDSLGVWGDDSFPAHRDQEIASRQELMRQNYLASSGITLVDLHLDSVEKIPIQHTQR